MYFVNVMHQLFYCSTVDIDILRRRSLSLQKSCIIEKEPIYACMYSLKMISSNNKEMIINTKSGNR